MVGPNQRTLPTPEEPACLSPAFRVSGEGGEGSSEVWFGCNPSFLCAGR